MQSRDHCDSRLYSYTNNLSKQTTNQIKINIARRTSSPTHEHTHGDVTRPRLQNNAMSVMNHECHFTVVRHARHRGSTARVVDHSIRITPLTRCISRSRASGTFSFSSRQETFHFTVEQKSNEKGGRKEEKKKERSSVSSVTTSHSDCSHVAEMFCVVTIRFDVPRNQTQV